MKPWILVAAALLFSPMPARADITMTMTTSMGNASTVVDSTMVTQVKGSKMRVDLKSNLQEISFLADAASQQVWMVDHRTKQVEPYDAQRVMGLVPASFGEVTVSMTPNGKTKIVQGWSCRGFDLAMSIPMTLSGDSIVTKIAGVAWMASEGPGIAEWRDSQKAFAGLGLSLSPLGQGPQGKAMAEATKAVAAAGVMLEQEITIAMEGTGPTAELLARVGGMRMTTRVMSISTDPVSGGAFDAPAGYSKK